VKEPTDSKSNISSVLFKRSISVHPWWVTLTMHNALYSG